MELKMTGEKICQIPLFDNLNHYEGETLLQITETLVFKENEVICKEGTEGNALYVILDGIVDIVKKTSENQFKTLARITKDQTIGEMTLIFKESSARTASAIARTRCRVLLIHKDDFQKLIDFGSIIAFKVTLNLCRILSSRLSHVDRELVRLSSQKDEDLKAMVSKLIEEKNEILIRS